MALVFDNVTLLSYQHTPVSFDAGIRYKVRKAFTIQGILLNQTATDGTSVILSRQEVLNAAAQDNQSILLNGVDFGVGRIINVSFDSGTLARENTYVYTIEATATGDLSNALTGVYSGIDWSGSKIPFVERLDEQFSFTDSEEADKVYQHTIEIVFTRDVSDLSISPITLAKNLASELLTSLNLTGFLGSYNTLVNKYREYAESYNAVNFVCSFSETITLPKNEVSGQYYSWGYGTSVEVSSEGITTVKEDGQIRGNREPRNQYAKTGFAEKATDALVYGRANAVYLAYGFSLLPLHAIVMQKSVQVNKFEGTIDYSLSFTNDPNVNEYAIWDYSTTIDKTQEGYITVSEDGRVTGIGRPYLNKFSNALAFYNTTVAAGIFSRLDSLYSNFGGTHTLVCIRKAYGVEEFAGRISYGQSWTDNNLYLATSPIKRQEIEVQTNYPVHIVVPYEIFNVKQIIQPQNNSTVGSRSIKIKLKGSRTTTEAQYLQAAKDIVLNNSYHDIGTDPYLADCDYTFTPNQNDFNISLEYAFHGFYKPFTELTLT